MSTRRRLLNGAIVGKKQVVKGSYTVSLNSNWQNSSINPDSNTYISYESYSNKGVHNSGAIMYIDIKNYSSFKLYIRSYAESTWDYVMVSQLDKTITYNTSYSDTSLIKAHTRGNQQSGTAISNYTLVEFTGIDGGEHRISVIYRKDGSSNSGDDKGYLLIAKDASNAGISSGNSSSGGDEGGSNEGPIDINNYLTIVALEDSLTAQLSVNDCEYCVDGDGNWKSLSATTNTESINTGQTLSFRGNLTPQPNEIGIGKFTVSKRFNLEGNCMSMLFGNDATNNSSLSGKNWAFYKLFLNCTNLLNVSDNFLPAETLSNYCYGGMFEGCSNLQKTPKLRATELSFSCYGNMFRECRQLKYPTELPATILAEWCYNSMFYNCINLLEAPELSATTLAYYCYQYMFYGCTNLTTAPELPATTLKSYCYRYMFYGCTKLNYIKAMFTTTPSSSYTSDWVHGVASIGTFVKNKNATWNVTGANGIPSGWTVITDDQESRLLKEGSNGNKGIELHTYLKNKYLITQAPVALEESDYVIILNGSLESKLGTTMNRIRVSEDTKTDDNGVEILEPIELYHDYNTDVYLLGSNGWLGPYDD